MHLRCVVAGFSQHIDHLSDGIFRFFRPFDDFHYGLVTVLSSLQLVFRNEDIVGQCTVLGHQECIRFSDFQCAHKRVVGSLQNFDHLPFGFVFLAFGIKHDAHFVVVHGMSRVAFGNENRIATVVGDERVFPVAFPLEGTGHFRTMKIEAEFSFFHFRDIIIVQHFMKDVYTKHFLWMSGESQLSKNVLHAECFSLSGLEKVD